MKAYYKKAKKILLFSLLFFISGGLFFYFGITTRTGTKEYFDTELNSPALIVNDKDDSVVLKNMPPPEDFKSFTHDNEKTISVDIKCKDRYATVLIYQKDVDYRVDPLSAKYNTATLCKNGEFFPEKIDITNVHLENGVQYYIVRAHQGERGMWHDPY
jgi:hypothetical protein